MPVIFEIFLVLLPFILVGMLGPWIVKFCKQLEMISPVCKRSAHKAPTPHGGGILIVAITLPLLLTTIWLYNLPHKSFLITMLVLSLLIAGMGWLDDIKHRSPALRLLLHITCVGIAVSFLPPLFDLVPVWVEKIILILAWSWFVNLYNFMDGLDGLSTTETIFISVCLMLFVPSLAPLAAIIAGASLGFLRVNWHPAKIFMGDVGSTFLGFVLGGLLLLSLEWDTWKLVYPLFTITLVFSADATFTLVKRVSQGHKPWIPHRDFWFHRAEQAGLNHSQVVIRALLINMLLLLTAFIGNSLNAGPLTLLAGITIVTFAALRIIRLEKQV